MKTLDRYIASAFLKNLMLATLGLTFLFYVQSLIAELLEQDFPPSQLLIRSLLNLPQVIIQMVPPASMMATVMTLSSLNRSSELTACFSLGFGLRRIMGVMLAIVLLVSCLMLVLQDRIVPPFFKKRTNYYWRVMKNRPDFFLDVKQNKIWYRSKNLIYNLQSFDAKSQTIHGMGIYSFDEDFQLMQLVEARKAIFTRNGWKLLEGNVTVFDDQSSFPLTQPFKEKELIIGETPQDFQEIEKEVDGLRLKELYRYIERVQSTGTDTKSFQVKFHSRISLCFIPIVMCLLGVPFSVRNQREGGMARDLGLCLAVTFFYWLLYSIGLSLGTNGALLPWLAAWLPSLIFTALAATLLARQRA